MGETDQTVYLEAKRRWLEGRSASEVSQELGVSIEVLCQWAQEWLAEELDSQISDEPSEVPTEDQAATSKVPEPLSSRNVTEEEAERFRELAEGKGKIPPWVKIRDEQDATDWLRAYDLTEGGKTADVVRDLETDRYIASPHSPQKIRPSANQVFDRMYFGSQRTAIRRPKRSDRCDFCGAKSPISPCKKCAGEFLRRKEELRAKSLGTYVIEKV